MVPLYRDCCLSVFEGALNTKASVCLVIEAKVRMPVFSKFNRVYTAQGGLRSKYRATKTLWRRAGVKTQRAGVAETLKQCNSRIGDADVCYCTTVPGEQTCILSHVRQFCKLLSMSDIGKLRSNPVSYPSLVRFLAICCVSDGLSAGPTQA